MLKRCVNRPSVINGTKALKLVYSHAEDCSHSSIHPSVFSPEKTATDPKPPWFILYSLSKHAMCISNMLNIAQEVGSKMTWSVNL